MKEVASVDASSYKQLFLLVEVALVYQSSLHWQGINMDQVFIEHVQFEISAYHQVEVMLRTVSQARYLMRPSLLEEVDDKELFAGQLRPDMNLFLVVTNECLCVGIE